MARPLPPLNALRAFEATARHLSFTQAARADHAEPLYLGRTMALQSTVGFTAGALGPVAFGLALDWAPWLGASPDGAWIWGFGLLGAGALVGPIAVGFRELSRAPRRI